MSLQQSLLDHDDHEDADADRRTARIGSFSYVPPQPAFARPIAPKPILVQRANSIGGSSPLNIAQSLPNTSRHLGIGSSSFHSIHTAAHQPSSPRRTISSSNAAWTAAATISPILIAQTHTQTGLIGSYKSPARPIFLSSTPPPTTFEELRQAQRNASSPATAAVARNMNGATGSNILVAVTTGDSPHPSPPGSPHGGGSQPVPPTVALSSISSTALPSAKDELRLIWRLAYPVALAILFRIAMAVSDVSILGHKNSDYLAAAASAYVWMNITSAFLYRAFGSSLNTLCSQSYGAGNFKLVGFWLQQALVFSTIALVLVAATWYWTGDVLRLFGIKDEIADLSNTYARWSMLWLPCQIWNEMLQRYFQAQQIIFPALVLNAIFVIVNFVLNLLLVFGLPSGWWPSVFGSSLHANGWAGLGFIGSPIATSISRWLMFIIYWAWCCAYKKYHSKTFKGWALNRSEALAPSRIKQYLLHQCLPNAIGVCLEEWQLEVVAIFATRLGSNDIATHNATLEIFFFLTSFMFGLTTAIQVRIGLYLGSSQPLAAKQVGVLGLKVSLCIGCVIGVCFVSFRNFIGKIYSNDPEIWSLAEHISIVVGASYALLAFFYVGMAVLNGQGRPFIVAVSYLIGCWCVCLPLSYVFAFTLGQGLIGLWYGLCIGYGVVTCIVSWKAYTSDWYVCAEEARVRAEMKKSKLEAEQAADAKKVGGRKRSSRRSRKERSERARAGSLNGNESITPAGAASSTRSSRATGGDSSDSDVRSPNDDVDSASSSELSSDEDVWNAEEIAYREEQLKLQRTQQVQQTTSTATRDINGSI